MKWNQVDPYQKSMDRLEGRYPLLQMFGADQMLGKHYL